jgi:hypothetical protein
MISFSWALETTLRLVAFSLLLQACEMIRIRASWSGHGPWAWAILRQEFRIFGRVPFLLLDHALSDRGFLLLLIVQLASALGCIGFPHLAWAPLMFATALLQSLRWRGTFNGGSDYMTILVLLALSVASVFGAEKAALPALLYIGVQVVASYFIAGLVKIKEPEWRNGRALQVFMSSAARGAPSWVGMLASRRAVCAIGGWMVIGFELGLPFLLLSVGSANSICGALLLAAFTFHVANALMFGLNRFVWAWLAGYAGVVMLAVLSGIRWV